VRLRRLALVAVLAAAGCGVPAEDTPRDVTVAPPAGSGVPAGGDLGPAVERLCLVRDGRLVRVERRVPYVRSANDLLRDLLAGPTAAESRAGLTSALATASPVTVTLTAGRAVVEVGDAGARSDEVLSYAQIVCTLGTRADVGTVSFTRQGRLLGVPRADGSLAEGPVTIADYDALMWGD
jgi:hypothetical protein